MRTIDCAKIKDEVAKLCIEANCIISDDVKTALVKALNEENSPYGIAVLEDLVANLEIAGSEMMPICQDTGMAVVFVDIGQDVHIVNGDLYEAINAGVAQGYFDGYLRASVVKDPFLRTNSGDNTPAVIHCEIVPGDEVRITLAPKGFGSENMSRLAMLKPSDGIEGVKKFVIETVKLAGANPCPPIILGIGIGGTMEKAAVLAKKALLRDINVCNRLEHIAKLEMELLDEINQTGIGPGGLGGRNTALGVNVDVYPVHIAGLPVAVNVSCHATRHSSCVI